ncbi:hypothetical protein [Natrarchaeobaculum aegyptiacum]|uniref:Uncharacterized protein n=1 Tax=Natrarchaeobaculum aegyptiacum TaxID=745377 RepID=A0A2Z2HPP9_9EURY|nr:hypothetical protein [Natrarchaeobaculum aegyptiacum]ARS89036.1 hypothetical protein B1756_04210 [Natrarchaeobaculum aegyptiacum]
MASLSRLVRGLLVTVLGILVVGLLATIVFAVTIFVVSTGAGLAGYDPSADFVVLAASLIVVAVILTGGFTPRLSNGVRDDDDDGFDDRTYN